MAKRERKRRGVRRIGEVFPQLLARRGYADVQRSSALKEAWQEVAGRVFSKHSRAVRNSGGVVEIAVANSATLQELTFRKKNLLRQLATKLSGETVSDIKFRVTRLS